MRILVADDDPISRRILQGILTEWGYEVTVASNGTEAWKLLQQDAPELAILDWVMPGMEGIQICEALRKRKEARYVYILLMTARSNKNDIVRGLQAGADDYLTKPYDPLELKARLIAGRRIIDLQEQLIAARELLRHQATRDPLTGVLNYRGIMEVLERELSRAQRDGKALGVILGDLDHFKNINDTHGHLAGDEALREVAGRLSGAIRPYDTTGRYGGEEFLVVLPGCDEAGIVKVGERIRERIAKEPVHYQHNELAVTISLGAVVHTPPNAVEIHALLHAADTALYWAKNNGRNRVELGKLGGV